MISHFFPVNQWNKDNPNKFRVDLFILEDDKQYFIYNIDLYQINNTNNINVAEEIQHLPTTQKAMLNAILSAGVDNDPEGYRIFFQ